MKKTVSVILSLLMIFGVFTACSEDETSAVDSENVSFTLDSHYDDIDQSSVRAYEKLCSAVISGENEVKLNTGLIDDVNLLFYTCFPLYPLVKSISISDDSSGVSIEYKNSEEEHLSLVFQFYEKIEEIKAVCGCGEVSTDRYIFNVYTYITQNIEIDNSVFTAFDTVIQGRGYSAAVCSVFEYLVLQGGGKASHIIGSADAKSFMSLVEFKGQWYYFNPAADIEKNQGAALTGFAMNSSRAGGSDYYYTDDALVDEVEDDTFDKLKDSASYGSDGDDITVFCSDGDSFVISFS